VPFGAHVASTVLDSDRSRSFLVVVRPTRGFSRGGTKCLHAPPSAATVSGIAPGCCCRDWPDRYEIVVGHFAKVVRVERHEGLSPPRSRNELNTDGIRGVHLDDGAKIPHLETVGRDVVCEDDNVEGMQRHESWAARVTTACRSSSSGVA